jgi:hypothetical protein
MLMRIHLAAGGGFMPQPTTMKSLLNRLISNWNIAAGLLAMWAWGIYLGAMKHRRLHRCISSDC